MAAGILNEFALADQFVQLFCPSHGHCLFCGFQIELLPGIYPPGSVEFPPDWTEPDITITVEEDGTPTYDEDEEPTTTSSTASTGQTLSTSVSRTSSVSSSATPSEDFLCVSTCSSCANVDPPSGTLPPKASIYKVTKLLNIGG